jgi:hypothetical protein
MSPRAFLQRPFHLWRSSFFGGLVEDDGAFLNGELDFRIRSETESLSNILWDCHLTAFPNFHT